MEEGGFFSSDCEENPHFCEANLIFAHYCSSDIWSGDTSTAFNGATIIFKGKNIVEELFTQLLGKYSAMENASMIVLSGASAGGLGVQNQGDRIAQLVSKRVVPTTRFVLIPDSGWFLRGPSYAHFPCYRGYCNVEYISRKAIKFLNLQFDESCLKSKSPEDQWLCGSPAEEGVASEITTPSFFTFYLYDSY